MLESHFVIFQIAVGDINRGVLVRYIYIIYYFIIYIIYYIHARGKKWQSDNLTIWQFPWWLKNECRTDRWLISTKTDGWLPWRQTNDTRKDVCVCVYHSCVCASVICLSLLKWKKDAYGTKKNRTSIDSRTTKVPKGRKTTGRRWSERSERNPCWWGATPAQAPTGRQTLSAPIHLLSLSLLRSSVRGVPHQQGFRPFRTPPPACSLSSLRDFGGTFADSRKKVLTEQKKIALLLTAASPL